MSANEFSSWCNDLSNRMGKTDREWFPKWVRRFAEFHHVSYDRPIGIDSEAVLQFCRSLLGSGTKAWQRLQAVRALEKYRDAILRTSDPSLTAFKLKLSDLAAKERANVPPSSIDVRGPIDPNEPVPIQNLREKLRIMRYAYSTEKAYVKWLQSFIASGVTDTSLERYEAASLPFRSVLAGSLSHWELLTSLPNCVESSW